MRNQEIRMPEILISVLMLTSAGVVALVWAQVLLYGGLDHWFNH